MPTCIDGHVTATDDYCDVCGAPVGRGASPTTSVKSCPACHAPVAGRFCEECGQDSAAPVETAAQPVAPVVWTAVVGADRDYHKRVIARGGPDTVEFPELFPERRIPLRDSMLIGRANRRQGIEPDIDLGIHPVDRGVSTQHAVLRLRDAALTITDLGSTNGTSINDSDDLLSNGEEVPVADGDRIHVGAWTTITIVRSE